MGTKQLDEAVELLKTEPKARNLVPEPRLFSQLAQCCLRERQGRRAVEVYRMMLEHEPTGLPAAAHSGLFGLCVKLNMLDTAAEMLEIAAASGARVDARDASMILEAAQRKRKTPCVQACSAAMSRMGFATPP